MRIKNKCKPNISKLILSLLKTKKITRACVREWKDWDGRKNSNIYLIVIMLINYLNSCITIGMFTRLLSIRNDALVRYISRSIKVHK